MSHPARLALTLALALESLSACSRPRAPDASAPGAPSAPPRVDAAAPDVLRADAAVDPAMAALERAVFRIDEATKARLRERYRLGAARGLRPDVFAKVGDSLTADPGYLAPLAGDHVLLAGSERLRETLAFFRRAQVDVDGHDSFTRPSLAATPGWTTTDPIAPLDAGGTLLGREFNALRPAFAFVLLGSNDLVRGADEAAFATNIARIVDECTTRGAIVILHTIPTRRDAPDGARLAGFNARVRALATERGLPLIDLQAALATLPDDGLGADGVHLNGAANAADFTPQGLRQGAAVRNWLALRALDALRRTVIADGPAEP